MLTSQRMLSLLLAAVAVIAILSGCYAAPVNEATEQGGETSGAIVTDSKIPVTTYPVPEENIRVFGNMAASASTGGFWQWNTFFRPYIQAYDPVTRTTYVPCYQSGCRHNDPTCNACFGDLQSLVEYRGNYYALVYTDDETASALVTRPLTGGPLQTLASWEPENENEACRCVLRCVSFGKAYVNVNRETYALTDGVQLTAVAQESSLVSVDLQTGEVSTILENVNGYDLYDVWGTLQFSVCWKWRKMRRNLKTGLRSSRRERPRTSMTGSFLAFAFWSEISKRARRPRLWMRRRTMSGQSTRTKVGASTLCIRSTAVCMSMIWRNRRKSSSLPMNRIGMSITTRSLTGM